MFFQSGSFLADFIQTSIGNGVAVVSLRRRPGATFDAELRGALLAALKQAENAKDASSIVLTSEVGALASDIPIRERLEGQGSPSLSDLCAWIDASAKPVVAALLGRVFDAGFELALAAHARVVQQSSRVRLSRLRSGVLPNPHALMTLASTLGAGTSMNFLESAASLPVTDKVLAALFDDIVAQNAVGRAADIARAMASGNQRVVLTPGAQDPLAYQADIQTARATPRPSPEKSALVSSQAKHK